MTRTRILAILVTAGVTGTVLAGLMHRRLEPLAIERITDNLFLITGGGGNTAVYLTADGVVLVDTKLPGYGRLLLERVRSITDKPVTHIINTHTHGDHVGNNEFFSASVEIIAHEQTAGYMARMENFAQPAAKHGLPDRTFKDRATVLSGEVHRRCDLPGRSERNDRRAIQPARTISGSQARRRGLPGGLT